MKKFLILLLFSVLSLSSFSQNPLTIYEVKGYLTGLGYTVDDKNIWSKALTQDDYFFCYKHFSPGLEYVIFAISEDGDVQDLDVYIYNSDGSVFKKDNDYSNIGLIEYSPTIDITRKCVVKNFKSNDPYYPSKCWLVVAYR